MKTKDNKCSICWYVKTNMRKIKSDTQTGGEARLAECSATDRRLLWPPAAHKVKFENLFDLF